MLKFQLLDKICDLKDKFIKDYNSKINLYTDEEILL